MEANMVLESMKFAALGMGVVFAFLYFMILILKVQSKVLAKFSKPETPANIPTPKKDNREDTLKKVAAIAAAIHHNKRISKK